MGDSEGTPADAAPDNVKLQALVVPHQLETELRMLLADLRTDSPSLMLRFSDAMRHALVRGVAESREELRQKRATLAQVPETLRPIRRVDTKKLAKKRTTPKRAARH